MTVKNLLAYVLWVGALALILYGAMGNWQWVLDKPLSRDAATEGVKVRAMSEYELTGGVSTDKVELNPDGMLQTRPSTGFCAT